MLWMALGTLLVAAIAGVMLSLASRTGMKQAATVQELARLRWIAHSALASVSNHLKVTGWVNRWYWMYQEDDFYATTLTFDGVSCSVYGQDRLVDDVADPGVVDLFVCVPERDPQLCVFQRVRLKSAPSVTPPSDVLSSFMPSTALPVK